MGSYGMELVYIIGTILSSIAAILAWISKIRWSNEYREATKQTINSKDAEIDNLRSHIKRLENFSPMVVEEYYQTNLKQMETILSTVQEQLEVANDELSSHKDEIDTLKLKEESYQEEINEKSELIRVKEERINNLQKDYKELDKLVELRTRKPDKKQLLNWYNNDDALMERISASSMDLGEVMLNDGSSKRVNEIASSVIHGLRSPLTLIKGYGKILQLMGNLDEKQNKYIDEIMKSVEDMRDLIAKALDFSRLEGDEPLEIKQFLVDQLITQVVVSLESQANKFNIRMNVFKPDGPLAIEGDFKFLTEALKILMSNALKYSNKGETVSLVVREENALVEFAVSDHGIGISQLEQRLLFQIQNEGDHGLMLAIVKLIAERHGGKVWVESELGKGSTFFLQIPKKISR
jgi:K+-sensing histidine kinase KdpD